MLTWKTPTSEAANPEKCTGAEIPPSVAVGGIRGTDGVVLEAASPLPTAGSVEPSPVA